LKVKDFIGFLRNFVDNQIDNNKIVKIFEANSDQSKYFTKSKVKVGLDKYKEIILQDETKLELGGINKKSFSLVYLTNEVEYIEDGRINLIGPEINEVIDSNVDFGMFILIGSRNFTEKDYELLRQFNFISNSIEGFLIRSIPRRFWCRISQNVIKKGFSFEFLGKAIIYLYKEKFKDLIDSIEIILINSYPELIKESITATSTIQEQIDGKWKEKVEEWRKRIDCEYDWGCEICPYRFECQEVKKVLIEREIIDGKNQP
jgi:CO dehydrogenase/acetyl-CoA synthase beta subunit